MSEPFDIQEHGMFTNGILKGYECTASRHFWECPVSQTEFEKLKLKFPGPAGLEDRISGMRALYRDCNRKEDARGFP